MGEEVLKFEDEKKIAKWIKFYLENYEYYFEEIIIVCIGTDKVTGDSLGPLVGTLLTERKISVSVYGTMQDPIHSTNFNQWKNKIKRSHKHPLIIVIDAAKGVNEKKGEIIVKRGSVYPALAVKKSRDSIGDISIFGVVLNPEDAIEEVSSVRLSLIWQMAKIIVNAISEVLYEQEKLKTI